MDRGVWNHEVAEVTREYPDAQWVEDEIGGHPTRVWRVTMNPIPAREELRQVLADLEQGREVCIRKRGQVGHFPDCEEPWDIHAKLLPRLRLDPRPYVVELIYPPFLNGDTGANHPRARVIDPEISRRTYPAHPHPGSNSYACPISPQATDWCWREGATLRYLDQVTLWILKSAVWILTGGGILASAAWLGPASPHGPLDHLRSIDPAGPCWCGEGKTYGACHTQWDIEEAISSIGRSGGLRS